MRQKSAPAKEPAERRPMIDVESFRGVYAGKAPERKRTTTHSPNRPV
jgi:hypothetical protein